MSQENVEISRRVMEAFNGRDRDAWLALNDPELEFRADPQWPEFETIRGREAVWEFLMEMADAWEQDDFEMVEFIHAGDDKLVGRYRRPVQGKASGVTDVLDYWSVGTFHQGRMLKQEWFASRDKALEAVGL